MEKKICFVVPTLPRDFHYGISLMKSFQKYQLDEQADLYFIFTTPEDRDGFLPCRSVVLPKSLRIKKNEGIDNIKKIYALMQLKEKYEYIISIDDKCLFCRKVDLMDVCTSFFEEKVLYGNIVENSFCDFANTIPTLCKKFFPKNAQKKVNCRLYLWYNQIPVYRTSDLRTFFKLTHMGKRIHNLTYNDYDYYIYMFYLIAYCGFEVVDTGIVADLGSTELVEGSKFKIANGYESSHLRIATQYTTNILHLPNVFIFIHQDRESADQKKHSSKILQLMGAMISYFKIKKTLS